MKCPRCWADKAYLYQVPRWKRVLLACLLLLPMKCHHCYHKFNVLVFSAIGRQVKRRPAQATPTILPIRRSHASQHYAALRAGEAESDNADAA